MRSVNADGRAGVRRLPKAWQHTRLDPSGCRVTSGKLLRYLRMERASLQVAEEIRERRGSRKVWSMQSAPPVRINRGWQEQAWARSSAEYRRRSVKFCRLASVFFNFRGIYASAVA